MSLAPELQKLIQEELQNVRQDSQHMLLPVRRRAIYAALNSSAELPENYIKQWLELLTVKHVLPLWPEKWKNWPDYDLPQKLVEKAERKLSGRSASENKDLESSAMEVLALSSEIPESPDYSFWCVFSAALGLFYPAGEFDPPFIGDEDQDPQNYDVARFAHISYARRIKHHFVDSNQLFKYWEWWETQSWDKSPIVPWTFYFDPAANLEFWTWWLTEAISEAWRLAN